jgi:hypothetical protein
LLCFIGLAVLTGGAMRGATAQPALQAIDLAQGGHIAYGKVAGANTQGAVLTAMLRMIHQSCGDKPQIGQVFKMRGTDSVGVFYTVVNRHAGNVELAGLIIAAASGPQEVQAGLVSDRADRFGQSINPMLTKLLAVWHPGGATTGAGLAPRGQAATEAAPGGRSAAGGAKAATVGRMHEVVAADHSASMSLPEGWTLDARSGGGMMIATGPNGEQVGLNLTRFGVDPTSPQQQRLWGRKLQTGIPGQIVYKFRGDLAQAFPEIFALWRRSGGVPPAPLRVEHIDAAPAPQGEHCVHAKGQIDPDGQGMRAMNTLMCITDTNSYGTFSVMLNHSVLPNALAEPEHDTIAAMVASFKLDLAVLKQQADAANAQAVAGTQQAIARIHEIGRQATARYNATEAANDAQHARYWAQQDSNAAQHSAWNATQEDHERYGQGFSNYLLDQTVIRDVQDPDTHATVWNRTAEAWKRAYPDRIEEVPTAQYIKGEDF